VEEAEEVPERARVGVEKADETAEAVPERVW
jgi:hypothetical protein